MEHLVYLDNAGKVGQKEKDKILNQDKNMIIRGATGRKIPHSRVFENETLYFIEKGSKNIYFKAKVESVQNYIKLTDIEIQKVLHENQKFLNLSENQIKKWSRKCLILIKFKDLKVLDKPLQFNHQLNMDDWLILEKIEDVLVDTSVKYNYENSKFKK